LLLHKLRGRAVVSQPIQIAEYFLRRELHENRIEAVRWLASEPDKATHRFAVENAVYEVKIAESDPLRVLSTSGDDFYTTIPQFKFINCKRIDPPSPNGT
jgi:hypothetical protein